MLGGRSRWTWHTELQDEVDSSLPDTCREDYGPAWANRGLLCQGRVDGSASGGDSGSPVFKLLNDADVALVASLWGGDNEAGEWMHSPGGS